MDGLEIYDLVEATAYKKILIYGEPGVGKTKYVAGAPKPLILDTEHGVLTLRKHPELTDIRVVPIRSWDQVEKIVWMLRDNKDSDPRLADRETLIIDSFSEAQRRVLDEQLRIKNSYIPQGTDYQENTERLRRFAMFIRDLPMNIIITCHVRTNETPTGEIRMSPDVTPKVGQTLLAIFDLIGFLRLEYDGEEKIRLLQTVKTDLVTAKSRLDIPDLIKNPDIKDIFNSNVPALQPHMEEQLNKEQLNTVLNDMSDEQVATDSDSTESENE